MVDEKDLIISVRTLQPSAVAAPQPVFTAKLWLTGVDKPGLLYHLSNVIADQKLNIEHLQTEQHQPTGKGDGPAGEVHKGHKDRKFSWGTKRKPKRLEWWDKLYNYIFQEKDSEVL